jgi:hypothetical protein
MFIFVTRMHNETIANGKLINPKKVKVKLSL